MVVIDLPPTPSEHNLTVFVRGMKPVVETITLVAGNTVETQLHRSARD